MEIGNSLQFQKGGQERHHQKVTFETWKCIGEECSRQTEEQVERSWDLLKVIY